MATEFDPYHKWLGIPAAEQPANLYRLLALNLFESDLDVIDMAANARMIHLRSLQHGQHVQFNQKLLNEIAAAQRLLLTPEKKAKYDAELRLPLERRAALQSPPPATALPPVPSPPASVLDFLSDAEEHATTGLDPANRLGFDPEPAAYRSRSEAARKSKSLATRGKQPLVPQWMIVLAPLLVVGVVVGAIIARSTQDADDPNVAANGTSTVAASTATASPVAVSASAKPEPNQKLVSEAPTAKPPIVEPPAKVARDDRTIEPDRAAVQPTQKSPAAEQPAVQAPTKVGSDDSGKVASSDRSEKIPEAPPKVAASDGSKTAATDVTSSTPNAAEVPSGTGDLPLGHWVDVLRLVDPMQDSVAGQWSRQGTEIVAGPGDHGRITVPVSVAGGFDLEVEFTRKSGKSGVGAMFSIGSHPTMVVLSGWGGNASGLIVVDGHEAIDNGNRIAVRPGTLENGHRYRFLIGLRILASDHASLDVSLDGNPYLPHWEGDPRAIGMQSIWAMPQPSELGIGAHNNDVTFHSARLRMISGPASLESPRGAADSALLPRSRP